MVEGFVFLSTPEGDDRVTIVVRLGFGNAPHALAPGAADGGNNSAGVGPFRFGEDSPTAFHLGIAIVRQSRMRARFALSLPIALLLLAAALGCGGADVPTPSVDAGSAPGPSTSDAGCFAVVEAYPGTCCSTAEQQSEFVFAGPRCFGSEAELEAWEDAANAALRSGECRAVHVGDPC